MHSSKLPGDDFCDSHSDPAAFDIPHDAAFPSPEVHSSSYLPLYHSPNSSHWSAQEEEASRTSYPGNEFGPETAHLYLSDQDGFETELYTTFKNSHIKEEPAAEDHMFGHYQALVPEDMDYDVYPFLKAGTFEDTGYDSGICSNSVDLPDGSATIHDTPKSARTSPKKSLACQFCDKRFTLQHDRLRHLRTLHRNQEDLVYRCAVPGCAKGDKIFNRLDNFKKHLKNAHENESPNEIVPKSRILSRDTFTIMTPEMYSHSQ